MWGGKNESSHGFKMEMQSFLTGLSQAADLTGEQHNEAFNSSI